MDFDFDLDIVTLIMIGVPIVLGGAGLFFFWRNYWGTKEEEILYFRCPSCKRKLKYYARQVGHRGMCNNCKEQFVFPTPLHAAR